jgi:hypothetical protein
MKPSQARARATRLRARAAADLAEAEALEACARAVEAARLPAGNGGGNIGDMTSRHRLRISATRGPAAGLAAAARAKGFTLRELAGRLGVSHALLSMISGGRRALTPALRAALQTEIGWPAE